MREKRRRSLGKEKSPYDLTLFFVVLIFFFIHVARVHALRFIHVILVRGVCDNNFGVICNETNRTDYEYEYDLFSISSSSCGGASRSQQLGLYLGPITQSNIKLYTVRHQISCPRFLFNSTL